MNNAIVKSVGHAVTKAGLKLRKHSPEILAATGAVGVVASAIMACKATTKVNDILEGAKSQVEDIHTVLEREDVSKEKYSQEDAKKDLAIVYTQTGVKLIKLYAPAVALGVLSLGCLLTSNNILRKRNLALAAAYATVDKGFKEYRGRVVERFGEAVDRELKYNIKAKKITDTVVDEETGKEKKVKKTVQVADTASGYARFFEEFYAVKNKKTGKVERYKNPYWDENPQYSLMFLKAQQQYANDILRSKGFLSLNEVYKMLGLPEVADGQVVGWIYDEDNPVGDNYVDFGIYDSSQNFNDFIYGTDGGILLDFNVDGYILDRM